MSKKKVVTFRLSEEEYAQLERFRKEFQEKYNVDAPRAEVVRSILRAFFNE